MKYLLVLLLLFPLSSQSESFMPMLEDILLVSVSGYSSISYAASDRRADYRYAELFANTLVQEMKQATLECKKNMVAVKQNKGALEHKLKIIIDSLKINNQFDDYKIISSALVKYSKNFNDTYFHADYRAKHPDCVGVKQNKRCEEFKEYYYFDDHTPVNGTVPRSIDGAAAEATCEQLMYKLLPQDRNSDMAYRYHTLVNNVCAELKPLKKCLAHLSDIDDQVGNARRTAGTEGTDANSIFDKFRTQESVVR